MPKLQIKEKGNEAKLEARLQVTSRDARKLKTLSETHYRNDPSTEELYDTSAIGLSGRASFIEEESPKKYSPTYKCSRHSIFLHTSKGKLTGSITWKSYLDVSILGKKEFVSDFFNILGDISNRD